MGRNNQQRRAAKKRREDRADYGSRREGYERSVGDGASLRLAAELAIVAGAHAAAARNPAEVDRLAVRLAGLAAEGAPVTSIASEVVARGLASLWRGGWQPAETARQVRRRRREAHVSLLASALAAAEGWADAAGAPMPAAWSEQLDDLGVPTDRARTDDWLGQALRGAESLEDGMRLVMETVGELVGLGPIEALIPRPAEWRDAALVGGNRHPDDPVLAKIRALLAKAESTQFAAEAEALAAKAQELMARHSIEDALARSRAPRGELPEIRRVAVDDPYAEAKSVLLSVVARANDARCVWYDRYAMMAVVGFAKDLDAIELLFTSLLVQASRAMLAKGSVTDGYGRSRTRSFRQSFLLAYANRIGQRLEMAAWQARQQASEDLNLDLTPVLASRDAEVNEAMQGAFPHVHYGHGPSASNEAGWRAGRIAAELATLGPEQGMVAAG